MSSSDKNLPEDELDQTELEPSPQQRRWILAVVVIGCILMVVLVLFFILRAHRTAQQPEAESAPIVSVRVAKAEQRAIALKYTALGTVAARAQALVSSKISAPIVSMQIWKNRSVRKGQVLAVLEAADLLAQRREALAALSEARANSSSLIAGTIPQNDAQDDKALRDARAALVNARANHERRLLLFQQGGISQKELEAARLDLTRAESDLRLAESTSKLRSQTLNPNDRTQAQNRITQAEERLHLLDAQLSYATVRAPIPGIVIDQQLNAGSFAAAGSTLLTIADPSSLIIKVQLADNVAATLHVGDAAQVSPVDAPDVDMSGHVTLVSGAVDSASRTVEVWISLAQGMERLRINSAVRVVVSTATKADAIVVPASAVMLDAVNGSEGKVMVVDAAGAAHETAVTVGIRSADEVEITSGLSAGETVVIEGNHALPDGTKVEVQAESSEAGPAEKDQKEAKP